MGNEVIDQDNLVAAAVFKYSWEKKRPPEREKTTETAISQGASVKGLLGK